MEIANGPERLTKAEVRLYLRSKIPRSPPDEIIHDTVFLEIENLLKSHPEFLPWAQSPRLYCLLRMLPQGPSDDDLVFRSFLEEELSDMCIPFRACHMPQPVRDDEELLEQLLKIQGCVLSRPDSMSNQNFRGAPHRHLHIGAAYFDQLGHLGKGGSASVEKVQHKLSGREFARKRILRGESIQRQREALVEFKQELQVLRRVQHKHFVQYVGSYTDVWSFSFILFPAAEMDLRTLLQRQGETRLGTEEISWLKNAFGCIATALAYLHDEAHIRHRDIKPGNILFHEGSVYLCDFGIARDWSSGDSSTTSGDPGKFTSKYSAPEVVAHKKRNESSDIWSLGCVYLEMITVIQGYSVSDIDRFIQEITTHRGDYWIAWERAHAWMDKLKAELVDDAPIQWIQKMIVTEPDHRISASGLVDIIQRHVKDGSTRNSFVGTCCIRYSGSTSSIVSPTTESESDDLVEIPLPISRTAQRPSITSSDSRSVHSRHRTSSTRSADLVLPNSPAERGAPGLVVPMERFAISGSPGLSPRSGPRSVSPSILPSRIAPDMISSPISPVQRVKSDSVRPSINSGGLGISVVNALNDLDTLAETQTKLSAYRCLCRPKDNERLIFGAPITLWQAHNDGEFHDKNLNCENRIQAMYIFENTPAEIWETTRRLVFCSPVGDHHQCASYWLPLGDIHLQLDAQDVRMAWSDCNHIKVKSAGNFNDVYNWSYEPETPNHNLSIQFEDIADTALLCDRLRCPRIDQNVRLNDSMAISPQIQAIIYNIGRISPRTQRPELYYRMIVLSDQYGPGTLSYKVFMVWPDLDLGMSVMDRSDPRDTNPSYYFNIGISRLTSPTYRSDVREEPAPDYKRKAKCEEVVQVHSATLIHFPIGQSHSLPEPPDGVIRFLASLTKWNLVYFGVCKRLRTSRKRLFGKDYKGDVNVMLWERQISELEKRCQLTLRINGEDSGSDKLWMSGAAPKVSAAITSSGPEASIKITQKATGSLLDISKMVATASESDAGNFKAHRVEKREESSELMLTFDDSRYRREFVERIERFIETATAAAAVASAIPQRSMSTGVSTRRVNSVGSSEYSPRPPSTLNRGSRTFSRFSRGSEDYGR